MISLTAAAAAQLLALLSGHEAGPSAGLRIGVETGGCAGRQYIMRVDQPLPDDYQLERAGARVLIDPQSLPLLQGSIIDYADELAGSGFRIRNPNATRSCGCGTSFEPAADNAQDASSHADHSDHHSDHATDHANA